MIAGLVVYALNFFTGKSKNNKLANAWLSSHKTLLEENFSLVGMLPLVLHKLGLSTSLLSDLHIISANFSHIKLRGVTHYPHRVCVCMSDST